LGIAGALGERAGCGKKVTSESEMAKYKNAKQASRILAARLLCEINLGQHRIILRAGSPASVCRWQREKRSCYFV
jgi:hypothetical protein